MQLDSKVDITIGCITGVIAVVTLMMSVLSYRQQCARMYYAFKFHE
jgi:hypothetical protein